MGMHPLMTWSGHDPARRSKAEANVRYWHIADIDADDEHVRFERNNGHDADVTRCLLMTQIRHPH